MIIGDEMVAAQTVKNVLVSNGYDVIGPQGTDSEDILQTDITRADLIFIGLILKGDLDGLAVAKNIRQKHQMPILFLTALDSQAFFSSKHRSYPDGYIFHPLKMEQILRSVRLALNMAGNQKTQINPKPQKKSPLLNHASPDAAKQNPISNEHGKMSLSEIVLFNAKEVVRPYINNLRDSDLDPRQKALLDSLESNFEEVVSPFLYKLSDRYFGLTHKELKVAQLIKAGLSTKDIANQFDLSTATINTHRNRIREKIGIKGQKQNLRRFLENFE